MDSDCFSRAAATCVGFFSRWEILSWKRFRTPDAAVGRTRATIEILVVAGGKKTTVFDEQATYKNPDYDVSFYTLNARLSPDAGSIAMTIVATAQPNKPIQLAEQGQANPEESQHIRKALATTCCCREDRREYPAPACLRASRDAGGMDQREGIADRGKDHLLVAYNVATGSRRKSTIRVEDAAHVFLR